MFEAWFAAFRSVIATVLAELVKEARDEVRKLPPADIGDNGQDFLDTSTEVCDKLFAG